MQEDKTKDSIDFKQWTTDFCIALQNKSSEVQLFAVQFDTFIDQILTLCELNAPNQESTSYFLENSIPSIIDVCLNKTNSIPNQEIKQAFIFIIANLTVLFQWIFTSDYFDLYHVFFSVFNENSSIYKNNNGGQKPSKMWSDSIKKFIDLSTFPLLLSRFQEEDVQIEHFYTCFQIFSYLMQSFDIKPTIEIGAQLFQSFQAFLNELTPENYNEKIPNTGTLTNLMKLISTIMSTIHDESAFLAGIESYLHLINVLVLTNNGDLLQTATSLISFFVSFNSEEVNNQLKNYVLQNQLYKKIKEMPIGILKLIINDIPKKNLLSYLLSLSSFQNLECAFVFMKTKKMKKFIKLIPDDDKRFPPLLIDTSFLAITSNQELVNVILVNSFDKLDLSSIDANKFISHYDQLQSQLSDICVSYLNQNSNSNINLPLVLKIFCEIIKKKPSILTDDILIQVYSHIVQERNVSLFPILDKAYVNSKRILGRDQFEMLFKLPDHKEIWELFNNMIKSRGHDSFDPDISSLIFYDFESNENPKDENDEKSENVLITNNDLSDPFYFEFIFNYILCVNIANKSIQVPMSFPNRPKDNSTPNDSSQSNKFSLDSKSSISNNQASPKTKTVEWIPKKYTVIKWPLVYFDKLFQLVIFNESKIINKNNETKSASSSLPSNTENSVIYKKVFDMLKHIQSSLIKPIIQTLVGILSVQTQNDSFHVVLLYLYEFVQNTESSISLRDNGIIQHYAINVPFECDLPNEVTVTYEKSTQTVRYDPQLQISELLRQASIKFGSTNDGLVLRNKENKLLSNQTLPNPGPEGYKMTGRLTPIKYDNIPSYFLTDEMSFNSFLLTKLLDDLPPNTEKLIESFLEYLPTDSQIQDLIFNVDDFIESLKTQAKSFLYFYMIKAAIHRSRSKELVSIYQKSSIFTNVKEDYLKSRFEHNNDHLFISFLCAFFNDTEIDIEMIKRLTDELRKIKNFGGDSKRAMELMIQYGNLSKTIERTTQKNPLSDYLIENNLVEPLITTCNDNIKLMMSNFVGYVIPHQYIYDLFQKYPNNSKVIEVFLSIFQSFLKEKDEKERDEIVFSFIDKFVSLNDAILKRSLDILLDKEIVKVSYIEKILQTSMFIPREPMRSISINNVVDFCMGEQSKDQNTNLPIQQQPKYSYNYQSSVTAINTSSNQPKTGIIIPDTEYKKCAYDFLDKITKIHYIGNDLYIQNPIRSNFEYVRQELFHLKPIRDCLLNPENQDYFVSNKVAHDLQTYFSKMILDIIPQFLYVKGNTLSPYKHLTQLISQIFSPEKRDQLITFVPAQCIVDISLFSNIETATPAIIVHLTHYAPSSIPLNIKVNDEMYALTGIIVKQKSYIDPAIANSSTDQLAAGQPNNIEYITQNYVYRTIVLEGGNWLIYQDNFITRINEEMLYPIFQAEFENNDPNSLKPYVLFYTKQSIIPQFTIDFNQNPTIKYEMLHFQNKDQLPQNILTEIEQEKVASLIDSFAISNTCASLFDRRADPSLLFSYFVNIYCRSSATNYSTQFKNKMLTPGGLFLPSLDLIISLIEPICESYKQITQLNFIDTLTLVISTVIDRNLTPDYTNKENVDNFNKVLKIIERFSELFPNLQFNFLSQSKISKIFHSFILNTNTFIKDDNEKEDMNDFDSYSICLSLNIPVMLFEAISSNFSKSRSVSSLNLMDPNDILSCLTCFVEMLGDSLHDLLVHISQIQASNINSLYLIMLVMKCIKYKAFTFDELKEVAIDPNKFFSDLNIASVLTNGITSFNSDQEFAEMADIFYDDNILIFFLDRLAAKMVNNKSLMQKMIQTASLFFLNLFLHENQSIRNKTFYVALQLINSCEENFTDFTVKLADHFNSELSLLLIDQIITTTICDHQLILQHLLKRAADVNFNIPQNDDAINSIDEVSDSTDIFASVADDNEETDENDEEGQERINCANAFFKVLEHLSIKDIDQYIPLIIIKLTTVDNLRFFIKNFDKFILEQFEKNEEELIPRILIYKHSLKHSIPIESKSTSRVTTLSSLEGYQLVAEFINAVLSIDPQSPIIKKIIINEKRGYVPYDFVQFIPAISTATKQEEIETFLPPKILIKSLNYSIAKANKLEIKDIKKDEKKSKKAGKENQNESKKEGKKDEDKKQPSKDGDKKEPSKDEDKKQPSKDEDKKEPSKDEDKKQPSKDGDKKEPSKDEDKKQPSKDEDKKEPSKEVAKDDKNKKKEDKSKDDDKGKKKTKSDKKDDKDDIESYLIGVQYFLNILIKHKEFDFSRLFLNIPDVSKFTSKFGNTKTSQQLIHLIKIIYNKNEMFKAMLDDEIETQLKRNSTVPNLEVIKMELDLNLDHDYVKNNQDNVVNKIAEMHKAAIQRSISHSPSSEFDSPYKLDTSDYIFHFYLSKHFQDTPIPFEIFPSSMLSSRVEKKFFKKSLKGLNDDEFLAFCKKYMKSSKTLSQITFDPLDMKRIWFLMKLKPDLDEKIKKMIPVDRRRVIMMLKLMPDGNKYALKVFNIKNEEIGLPNNDTNNNNNNNNNNNDNDNQNSSSTNQAGIQREASSVPNLSNDQAANRRPPPPNNNNNSANSSANASKPYFFKRPTTSNPKKP